LQTWSKKKNNNKQSNSKGPFQIGDLHSTSISSNDFNAKPDGKSLSFTLTHENASFLSIHYKKLDLPHSCSVTLTDENGGEEYTSTGKGLFNLGSFWAHHINSDTMIITLRCKNSGHIKNSVIDIDQYTAGFPIQDKLENNRRSLSMSICGSDDKRNAICYKNNDSSKYNKSKAVARLLVNGSGACTGWLVGRNLLLTNHHCIASLSDVQNTDFEFMAEENVCSSSRDGSWFSHRSTAIHDGVALVAKDSANDFALIRMESNLGDTYGYFELDNREPDVGEAIYIPQHPGGRPKEIAIYDSNESGGSCKVKQFHRGGCTGSAHAVRYSCDTEGGTSGSPVVSDSTNKVIALHNCGGACNGNMGVPVTDFYSQISEYLSNDGGSGGSGSSVCCNDSNVDCLYWKNLGYCSHSYVEYMRANCKQTCGVCQSESGGSCCDSNENCSYWKDQGYCSHSYVDYMSANCKQSCGVC